MSDFLPCLLPPPLSISESDRMSNWKLVAEVCMLLFFCQVCTDARSIQQCIGPYDRIVGKTCQPCPTCKRGWGLSEWCGSGHGENAICQRCVSGTSYNPKSKYLGECRPCTDCQKHLYREVEFKCRSVADAKCGKCMDGYYDKHEDYLGVEKHSCTRCSYKSTHPACAHWKSSQATPSSSARSISWTTLPLKSTTPPSTPKDMSDHSTLYLTTPLQAGDEGIKEVSTWSSSTNVLWVVFPILMFLSVAVAIFAICVYCFIRKKNAQQNGKSMLEKGLSAQYSLNSGHIGGTQYQKDTEDGTSNGEVDDVLIDESNEKTSCIRPQRLRHNSSSSSHSVNFGMDCDEIYRKQKKQQHEIGPVSVMSSQVLSTQANDISDAIKANDVDIEEKRLYQDEKKQRASPESLFVKPSIGEPAAAESDMEIDADQSRKGFQTSMAATELPKQHSSEIKQLQPMYNAACLNNTVDEPKTCHESRNIASLKTDRQQPLVTVQVFNGCLAASHPNQAHTQSCLAASHPNQTHIQSGASMQSSQNDLPIPNASMSAVTDDMNVFEKEQRDKMKQAKRKEDTIYKEAVEMTEDKQIDEIDFLTRDRLLYKILDAKRSDLHRLGAQLEVPEGDLRLLAKAEDLFIILETKRVTVSALLIALRSIGHHRLVIDLVEWVLSKYAKTPNGALEVTMATPIEET